MALREDHRMRGGEIGRKRFSSVFMRRWNHIRRDLQAKTVSRPRSDARFPADGAGRSRRAGNRAARRRLSPHRRPRSATGSGPAPAACKQARTLTVMPDHLQETAAASTKTKQLATQRIALQYLLHLQRQARKALPHVGVAGRQPNPNPCRKCDHGSVSSPRRIRSRTSTSTSRSTMTRRPFVLTISIRPQPDPISFAGGSGTIIAGTNPAAPSRPVR